MSAEDSPTEDPTPGHVLAPAEHAHLISVELARLATVKPEHLGASLPHIEGWTVHNVIGHTGWICRYVDLALAADPDTPPARASVPEPPAGADVFAWFNEARSIIGQRLDTVDPSSMHPSWTGPWSAAQWMRRLANEASMHRWDAYAAFASPEPIDARLAADGIEEVFEVFAPQRLLFTDLDAAGKTMHLHATDIEDGEWTVEFTQDGLTWERSHSKADVAARGPISDLLLLLWSRIPPSRLQLFGDATLFDRWQAAAKF